MTRRSARSFKRMRTVYSNHLSIAMEQAIYRRRIDGSTLAMMALLEATRRFDVVTPNLTRTFIQWHNYWLSFDGIRRHYIFEGARKRFIRYMNWSKESLDTVEEIDLNMILNPDSNIMGHAHRSLEEAMDRERDHPVQYRESYEPMPLQFTSFTHQNTYEQGLARERAEVRDRSISFEAYDTVHLIETLPTMTENLRIWKQCPGYVRFDILRIAKKQVKDWAPSFHTRDDRNIRVRQASYLEMQSRIQHEIDELLRRAPDGVTSTPNSPATSERGSFEGNRSDGSYSRMVPGGLDNMSL